MPRVVHFEIYTDDPDAVRPFYQDVFGWKFQKFEGGPIEYWLVTTGDDREPGINGGGPRPRGRDKPGAPETHGGFFACPFPKTNEGKYERNFHSRKEPHAKH